MNRIVQLSEHEYNKLSELAKLNEQSISEQANALWKEKGVAEVTIRVNTGSDYDDSFSLKCGVDVWYKDQRFYIPERLRRRLEEIIRKYAMESIEERFGDVTKTINQFRKRSKALDRTKYILWGVAASGWAVATVLWLYKL